MNILGQLNLARLRDEDCMIKDLDREELKALVMWGYKIKWVGVGYRITWEKSVK